MQLSVNTMQTTGVPVLTINPENRKNIHEVGCYEISLNNLTHKREAKTRKLAARPYCSQASSLCVKA